MILTRTEFNSMMKTLKAVYTYSNFLSDPETLEIWYGALSRTNYSVEFLKKGINAWVANNGKPPTPADIIEYTKKVNEGGFKPQGPRWQHWILIDNKTGIVENEVVSEPGWKVDEVAAYFRKVYDLNGKTIRPVSEMEYRYGQA